MLLQEVIHNAVVAQDFCDSAMRNYVSSIGVLGDGTALIMDRSRANGKLGPQAMTVGPTLTEAVMFPEAVYVRFIHSSYCTTVVELIIELPNHTSLAGTERREQTSVIFLATKISMI